MENQLRGDSLGLLIMQKSILFYRMGLYKDENYFLLMLEDFFLSVTWS
jgi:hypothetical protein